MKSALTQLTQRLGNFCRLAFLIAYLILPPWCVSAEENLGKLELAGFMAEPTASIKEVGGGNSGFSLGTTKFSVRWTHDSAIGARLTLGQQSLLGRTSWAGVTSQQWGLVEGFGEYLSPTGIFRMGWIPLGFGYEGRRDEAQALFPRSLVFQNRWIPLRDLGASFQISNAGFYTRLLVHNGESAEDADNRTLQTALWGWQGGAGIHTGLSATAGRYVASDNLERRLRIGNLFAAMDLYGVGFCAEATLGETKTDSTQQQFLGWHLDLQHSVTPSVGVLARFDLFDPTVSTGGDLQREWILGLSFKNEHETSRIFIYGIKRFEEPLEKSNDEVRLVWRLNSSYAVPSEDWGKSYGSF